MIGTKVKNLAISILAVITMICLILGFSGFSNSTANAAEAATSYIAVSTVDSTTTYNFADTTLKPSSSVNIGGYFAAGTTDKGFTFKGNSSSDVKFHTTPYLTVKKAGYIYVPVAAGSYGTISMVQQGSGSNGRWLDLVKPNGERDTTKRMYSKPNATEEKDTKGPQSFDFTADDLTTISDPASALNGNTYLVLQSQDDTSEVKINSMTVKLTALKYSYSYNANGGTEAPAGATDLDNGAITLGVAPTAPAGKQFAGWSDGTTVYQAGASYTLTKPSTTFTAVYNTIITAVENPADISKVYFAEIALSDLKLDEAKATATTIDGEIELDIVWNETEITALVLSADLSTTLNGEATLPDGYVFAEDTLKSVAVNILLPATAPKIESIAAIDDIDVLQYTSQEDYESLLPTEVTATLVGGATVKIPVSTWNQDPAKALNLTKADTYTLTAVLLLGEQYDLNGQSSTLNVNVKTINITSASTTLTAIASVGQDKTTLILPEEIEVTLADTTKVNVPVKWNLDALDTSAAAEGIVISGSFDLTDLPYTNTTSVVPTLTLDIVAQTTVSFKSYADYAAGTPEEMVAWTDKIVAQNNGVIINAVATTCDNAHAQTMPMLKFDDKGQLKDAIEIIVPEKATKVEISVDAVTYSGSEGKLYIKAPNGDILNTVTAVTASSNTAGADYVAFTPNTFTATGTVGGTYHISAEDSAKSVYVTAITVNAVVPQMYEVQFDANAEGATAPQSAFVEKNGTIILGEATPAAGYTFKEWNTLADGKGTSYAKGASYVASTLTSKLFAQYIANVTEFDNTFIDIAVLAETLVGTDSEKIALLNLPATTTGKLADGTAVDSIAINWDTTTLTSALFAAGNYTLTGTLVAVEGHPFDKAMAMTLTQKVKILSGKIVVTSYAILPDVNVLLKSTTFEPASIVTATLEDATTVDFEIVWSNLADVDLTVVGEYTLNGEITINDTLYDTTTATKAITQKIVVYNYTVTSIETKTITVLKGLSKPVLPTSVTAHYMLNGVDTTIALEVESWTESIDMATANVYDCVATLKANEMYAIDTTIVAKTVVTVKDFVTVSDARSTNFSKQSIAGAGNFRGFTLSGTVEKTSAGEQKIKNGFVSFTLTAPAKVTIAYSYEKTDILPLFGKDTTVAQITGAAPGFNVFEQDLDAGTYKFGSTATSGSIIIKYIIIDDGCSEIFAARSTETTVKLPETIATKTVGGITYNFMGYTDGTEVYKMGDSVAASAEGVIYYAIYAQADATTVPHGAMLSVGATKKIRFQAVLNALNADQYLDNLIASEKFTFTTTLALGSTTIDGAVLSSTSADKIERNLISAIAKNTDVYTAKVTIAFGLNAIYSDEISCSAKQLADITLADLKNEADALYRFEDENGKFSFYLVAERDLLKAYAVDDSTPVTPDPPVDPDPDEPNPPVDPDPDDSTSGTGDSSNPGSSTSGAETSSPADPSTSTSGAETSSPADPATSTSGAETSSPADPATSTSGAETSSPADPATSTSGAETSSPADPATSISGAETSSPASESSASTSGAETSSPSSDPAISVSPVA